MEGQREARVSPAPSTPSVEKPFVCTELGCARSFIRSEHLSRHRLNHRPRKIFTCSACPKRFVRPDLYQRHQARHVKGMWYRNVGGVLNNIATGESTCEAVQQNSANDTCQTEEEQASSHENVESQCQHNGYEYQHDLIPIETSNTVDDNANRYQSNTTFAGLNFNYGSPPSGPDTLFFDGSANIYDLPEGLDWFFEDPQLDPLPGLDIQTIQPMSPHQSFLPPVSVNHQPSVPILPPLDSASWSIVQARLTESLRGLAPDILQSCFFLPSNLARCYELYFQNYHEHFPILHRPTLLVTKAEPLLLASIITLGSTRIEDDVVFSIGQKIHDSLRWIIFQTGKFEPPSPLWCLQALLVLQAQAKMFSTQKHHEMAHVFHGSILTMMKRSRAYSPVFEETINCTTEHSWRRWAEQESSRRTAFFAFLMDAQHASIFGHTPVLCVSDVRLPLPCAESLWECETAARWQALSPRSPQSPQFLPTLKAVLAKTLVPATSSGYSRLIILHGLLSLTTHLHAQETTTLGIKVSKLESPHAPLPVSQVEDWIETISRAIGTWSLSLLSLEPSLCLEAARPLHRMAFMTLHTNITDFQILVKDPALLDNQLSKREAAKAEARVRAWTRKEEAKRAVMHSLLLIEETVLTRCRRYRAQEDNISPRPWCLYQAIIVLWVYGVMTEGLEDEKSPTISTEEYVGRMLSILQGESPGKVIGANRTRGLVAAMRDVFEGCRWALLEEAHQTLKRLAATQF